MTHKTDNEIVRNWDVKVKTNNNNNSHNNDENNEYYAIDTSSVRLILFI